MLKIEDFFLKNTTYIYKSFTPQTSWDLKTIPCIIHRIFHSASQSARRPSYISPRSQLIITAVLVSVQFMATLVWVVASTPEGEKTYPDRSEVRTTFTLEIARSVSYCVFKNVDHY